MWKLRDVRREVAARPYHTCDAHDISIRACLRLGPAAAIDRRLVLDTVLFTAVGSYRSAVCSIRVSELVWLRFGPPSALGILVAPRICGLTTEEANLDIQLHIPCRSKEREA